MRFLLFQLVLNQASTLNLKTRSVLTPTLKGGKTQPFHIVFSGYLNSTKLEKLVIIRPHFEKNLGKFLAQTQNL